MTNLNEQDHQDTTGIMLELADAILSGDPISTTNLESLAKRCKTQALNMIHQRAQLDFDDEEDVQMTKQKQINKCPSGHKKCEICEEITNSKYCGHIGPYIVGIKVCLMCLAVMQRQRINQDKEGV